MFKKEIDFINNNTSEFLKLLKTHARSHTENPNKGF